MYKAKKYNCIEDYDNACSGIYAHEAIAHDSTNYYYPSVIIKLEDDEVTFYDFYPSQKRIKLVTKEIEFDNEGQPFFRWRKQKYFLKDFLRMKF